VRIPLRALRARVEKLRPTITPRLTFWDWIFNGCRQEDLDCLDGIDREMAEQLLSPRPQEPDPLEEAIERVARQQPCLERDPIEEAIRPAASHQPAPPTSLPYGLREPPDPARCSGRRPAG
jgi:hypothetical protein